MAEKRYYGWIRQQPDPRDHVFKIPQRVRLHLPAKFDLSASLPPQKDQGQLGSCGPNTAAECLEFNQTVQQLPTAPVSRLFIYYNTRLKMGTTGEDSGVDNRTLLKAINAYGFCPEALWPYDISKFTDQPPDECYKTAADYAIDGYATVNQTLLDMKSALVMGHPFIFGFDVYPQINSDQANATGVLTMPGPLDTPEGGHDVTICAYSDETQMLKFRNHWLNSDGTPWGDNGYGYIPYAYATNPNLARDFWVIHFI